MSYNNREQQTTELKMFSLIITTNSQNDKIAVLFDLSVDYAAHKAECAALAPSLEASLVGKADKVNGKTVSAEDAAAAVAKVVAAANNEADTGAARWATSVGNGIIVHNTKGTEYLQGRAIASIVIEEAAEKKEKKARGSRSGATLANKLIASMLPKWKMTKLEAGYIRFNGQAAVENFEALK